MWRSGTMRAFGALAAAGFRRWAAYRQATVAAAFTNTVFGFLRAYVLLAVLAASGAAAVGGYDAARLATFVWVGQGLFGVVLYGGWTEVADRVRSGEVAVDLWRPVDPLWAHLAADLGRAGYAAVTRLVVPVVVGALAFDLHRPERVSTWMLVGPSVVLAVVISFALRYLVNLTAFWLLDVRGVVAAWTVAAYSLSGLLAPLTFFPPMVQRVLWATPFPGMYQVPLDVLVERTAPAVAAWTVAGQAAWAAGLLGLCALVQRRAERVLVVQGG